VSEVDDAPALFDAALDAMTRGDVPAALDALQRCLAIDDLPAAHFLLGGLAYWDDRLDEAREEWEQAFRGFRAVGDLQNAARVATGLGELHWGSLGNEAAGRGWIERARRLLDQVGPCVEWGYWELAQIACDRPDVDDLERSAARALEIAAEYGDTALEVRALADGGLALVSQGRVREGFLRLDEALASLTSGEVQDPFVVGTAFCSLLSSCDRAGDVERVTEWMRIVRELVLEPAGDRPRVLSTHCRLAFGGVLSAVGRFTEAEAALLAALGPDGSVSAGHRTDATARLAELRLQQGRVDEAAELLAPIEDHLVAAGPLAAVHLQRGEPALAVAVLRRAVKQLVGDVLRGGPLLGVLVEAELARGDLAAARDAARLLHTMTAAVDTPVIAALASISDGRIAAASGRPAEAVDAFDAALHTLAGIERPTLVAVAHLELAGAHAATGDTDAAIASARASHAAAQRLGAVALTDRSASVLRRLGASPPRVPGSTATAMAGLTPREHEVLDGLRRGDSNAQIASRLYLSPKTVEHHVSRVLAKLGVRTRAEAAAVAAAAGAAPAIGGE
jgi:DNA-binding NarL/FixJ family response regulator